VVLKTLGPPGGWLVPGVLVGGLVPAADLALAAVRGRLGADPISEALNRTGLFALVLLLLCLACTPLRVVLGAAWFGAARRTLGLLAFGYAALHFSIYLVLDQGLRLGAVAEDVAKRPFILVGFTALCLLVPLAATSTKKMIARLGGKRWRALHRLVYVIGVLAIVHFVLRVKKDLTEPLTYGAVLAALLGVRVVEAVRARRPAKPPGSAAADQSS